MENPCEKCIIKVNCTEVCFPKKNYGILLEQGTESHWSLIKSKNTNYWKQYRKLLKLLNDHRVDENLIQMRGIEAKSEF